MSKLTMIPRTSLRSFIGGKTTYGGNAHRILIHLNNRGVRNTPEIGAAVGVQSRNLWGLLDQMKALGLIVPAGWKRHAFAWLITPKGRETARTLAPPPPKPPRPPSIGQQYRRDQEARADARARQHKDEYDAQWAAAVRRREREAADIEARRRRQAQAEGDEWRFRVREIARRDEWRPMGRAS